MPQVQSPQPSYLRSAEPAQQGGKKLQGNQTKTRKMEGMTSKRFAIFMGGEIRDFRIFPL